MNIEIENKTIFFIGLGALAWGITFDMLNIIVAKHFWPVCAITYMAASLLIYVGVKGELPGLPGTLIIIVGCVAVVVGGMYVMSIVNNHPMI